MKTSLLILFIVGLLYGCGSSPTSSTDTTVLSDSLKIKTLTLQVNGMTCEGCEQTITKYVKELPGVSEVQASYIDSFAVIAFDTSQTNISQISETINNLGYSVIGEQTESIN